MRSKQLFQWPHRSALLLIASIVVMLSTGCVCLFACSNPPPMACSLPDELRVCKNGLFIKLVDKNKPMPLHDSDVGIEKNFQLIVQSDKSDDIKIACISADAENAHGLRPTCNFISQDKVSYVFIENLITSKASVIIERENYKETFSDLSLSYIKEPFDLCGPSEPVCNIANLTLEVE